MDLYALQKQFGGTISDGGTRWRGPGPGHSRQDRSASVIIGDNGRPIVHSFVDHWKDVAAHLGLEHAPAHLSRHETERQRKERQARERQYRAVKAAFCGAIWRETEPAVDSIVEVYLRGRSIEGPIPRMLRFHPNAPLGYRRNHTVPCMVALVVDARGHGMGLHLTPLKPDGSGRVGKRIMLGRVQGGAVRLGDCTRKLALAEGVETAASFSMLHGVPSWAVLSTSGLVNFEVPFRVEHIIVGADGDGPGMKAARQFAERPHRRAEVIIAPAPNGLDWNDVARSARP